MPDNLAIAIPPNFFPGASSKMRQFFWQHLTIEQSTIHDTLMQYLSGSIKTPIEQEVACMIADTLETDWANFRATEKIKSAV